MSHHDMLMDEIKNFVSTSSCRKIQDMIARARERKIELEPLSKRKSVQVQTMKGSS